MFKRLMLGMMMLAVGIIVGGVVLGIIASLFPAIKPILDIIAILIAAIVYFGYVAVFPEAIGGSPPSKEKRPEKSVGEQVGHVDNQERPSASKKLIPAQNLGLGIGSKVEIPETIKNEIDVIESNGDVVTYCGTVSGIRAYGASAIFCSVSIEKFSTTVTMVSHFRRLCWYKPWIKEFVGKRERVNHDRHWIVCGNGNSSLIVHRRSICKDRDGCTYRGELISNATPLGIALPDKLLDTVFDPIDKKCLEISNQIAHV